MQEHHGIAEVVVDDIALAGVMVVSVEPGSVPGEEDRILVLEQPVQQVLEDKVFEEKRGLGSVMDIAEVGVDDIALAGVMVVSVEPGSVPGEEDRILVLEQPVQQVPVDEMFEEMRGPGSVMDIAGLGALVVTAEDIENDQERLQVPDGPEHLLLYTPDLFVDLSFAGLAGVVIAMFVPFV